MVLIAITIWIVATFAMGAVIEGFVRKSRQTLGACFISGVMAQLVVLAVFVMFGIIGAILWGLAAGVEFLLQSVAGVSYPWGDGTTFVFSIAIAGIITSLNVVAAIVHTIEERRTLKLPWQH
jgi:hypothetical protein